MRVTRVYARKMADARGYEDVQVDGIPEGFAFKEADITINGATYNGQYVAFIPLSMEHYVKAHTKEQLVAKYNTQYGK